MNSPHRYSRQVPIGEGAFASVYRVFDTSLQRYCAIKKIPAPTHKQRQSIIGEARMLAAAHPSCAPHIYDVQRSGKNVVIVMEWLHGIPWSVCTGNNLTFTQKVALATDALRALSYLHERSIAHADLKPGNLLAVPDRGIVFVDFGFARDHHTESSGFKGTPAYMAPELWQKDAFVNWQKADLYSLGVMLQELFGDALPECAKHLADADPQERPADATLFLHLWLDQVKDGDHEHLQTWVAQQSAFYTATLLYNGARALISKKRLNEAYAILTESIDYWPDNPDALTLLQTGFSLPFARKKQLHYFFRAAAVLLFLLIIAGAYRFGRQSMSALPEETSQFDSMQQQPLLVLPSSHGHASDKTMATLHLRNSAPTLDIPGTVFIVTGMRKGRLFVDGNSVPFQNDASIRLELAAGTHRIEWHDGDLQRRFGETIDVLPFCSKSISFARFFTNE